MMLDRVTISKFSELSGYTEGAIRQKIQEGVWLENDVFSRAPDNRILISLEGYESWVDNKRTKVSKRSAVQSVSDSLTQTRRHGRGSSSNLSPLPLT
jgi:hypothetical protein